MTATAAQLSQTQAMNQQQQRRSSDVGVVNVAFSCLFQLLFLFVTVAVAVRRRAGGQSIYAISAAPRYICRTAQHNIFNLSYIHTYFIQLFFMPAMYLCVYVDTDLKQALTQLAPLTCFTASNLHYYS